MKRICFSKNITCPDLSGNKHEHNYVCPSLKQASIGPLITDFIWKNKIVVLLCLSFLIKVPSVLANEPDSAYIFSYATQKNGGHNGLHFAWSIDKKIWHAIGPEYRFLFCDYGRWGSEKRMISPYLFFEPNGTWHCVWSVNEKDGAFAHAMSTDLVYWKSQSYPVVSMGNCLMPEISKSGNTYTVTWLSGEGTNLHVFSSATSDLKNYSPARKIDLSDRQNLRQTVEISGNPELGTVQRVSWKVIDNLIKSQQLASYKNIVYSERANYNSDRFTSLKSVKASISVDGSVSKDISDLLIGIFFEDINYAADGGLYAELIQNRGFEYSLSDKEGKDKSWDSYKSWSLNGEHASLIVDTVLPIHPNNKHFAVLNIEKPGAGLVNEGFDGIAIKSDEKYNFSLFARVLEGKKGKLIVRLIGRNGEVYGEAVTQQISGDWKKYETLLTANKTVNDARLEVVPQITGKVALDMISLFPQKTFMGRKNGLRADLAQTIADIHPRFVRFPGGCVAHGDGLENMYRWKNTIGPLEARKTQRNLWGYSQSAGLGYYEYFQFCEDMGAEPLPVVAAGVPCQNSATGGAGQQGGLPMCDMDNYIQEVLDLIEWANGDVKTKWGKMRAETGHPKPFNLKYIGIGNEDLITDIFEERFAMIFNAVKKKYPAITVIGTVGPSFEGTDYVEGWRVATSLNVPMVDEHYYQSPGWFINNQDYYDRYDRSKSKVYLGEYAAHVPGRHNNIETALAEAIHIVNLERNGDVVSMSSYAPLLAKEGHTQWSPDLIYFNNVEVKPTVGYYVQKICGQNSGNQYLPSEIIFTADQQDVKKRVAVSFVRDRLSNDLIVKMVNYLPVEVNSDIRLNNILLASNDAVKTIIQGNPDDKDVKPQTENISVDNTFACQLPAFSLTVIRIKTKK